MFLLNAYQGNPAPTRTLTDTAEKKRLIECPVCFDALTPPIITCENGHGICNNCRKKVTACGICRANFTKNQNTLLNQVVESLVPIPKCKNWTKGCSYQEPSAAIMKRHETTCEFKNNLCVLVAKKYPQETNSGNRTGKPRTKSEVRSVPKPKIETLIRQLTEPSSATATGATKTVKAVKRPLLPASAPHVGTKIVKTAQGPGSAAPAAAKLEKSTKKVAAEAEKKAAVREAQAEARVLEAKAKAEGAKAKAEGVKAKAAAARAKAEEAKTKAKAEEIKARAAAKQAAAEAKAVEAKAKAKAAKLRVKGVKARTTAE